MNALFGGGTTTATGAGAGAEAGTAAGGGGSGGYTAGQYNAGAFGQGTEASAGQFSGGNLTTQPAAMGAGASGGAYDVPAGYTQYTTGETSVGDPNAFAYGGGSEARAPQASGTYDYNAGAYGEGTEATRGLPRTAAGQPMQQNSGIGNWFGGGQQPNQGGYSPWPGLAYSAASTLFSGYGAMQEQDAFDEEKRKWFKNIRDAQNIDPNNQAYQSGWRSIEAPLNARLQAQGMGRSGVALSQLGQARGQYDQGVRGQQIATESGLAAAALNRNTPRTKIGTVSGAVGQGMSNLAMQYFMQGLFK